MGFPKTVMGIDADYSDTHATFVLRDGASVALRVTVPRVEPLGEPTRIETVSYSYLDGTPYETPLAMDLATGVVEADQVVVELGSGPIADELSSLGLPCAPDFASYGERLGAVFQLGTTV